MTVIYGLTRLHYGADYLGYTIKSLAPFVRRHIILYSPTPTFGNYTELPNPDDRDTLMRVAFDAGGNGIEWIEGRPVEVAAAVRLYPDADMFIELDADEVIQPELARNLLSDYERGDLTARIYRLPFLHFWRSFSYTCDDSAYPMRVYLPKAQGADMDYYPAEKGRIFHFGYARREADMRYKVALSVHRPEWRQEWWSDIWGAFPDRLTDLHPVCVDGFWNAQLYDKWQLPDFMCDHPYFGLDKIE
jgi:hypothetical protein